MARAKLLPQLPVEVWEWIIDFVAGDHDRVALRACCLTCNDWLPRSRFHLFTSIVLRSKQHLVHVVNTICNSPALCNRVCKLTIIGDDDGDSSWISVAPLQLAPKLKSLQHISFRRVDFRKTNPRIQACFALFRPILEIDFKDIEPSQLNQMIRLASAVRAEIFSVDPLRPDAAWSPSAEAPHNITAGLVALPSPHNLALQYPNLRYIDVSLPPDLLSSISRSWSFPVASLSNVFVRTDWPGRNDPGWRMHLGTLRRIINFFQQICVLKSLDRVAYCDIVYWMPPGSACTKRKCFLILQCGLPTDHDLSQRGRLRLQLTYYLDTANHDDFISAARFMSEVVAHARPDVVDLHFFDRETGTTHPNQITWTPANDSMGPTANLLARWKCIDDALSSDVFAEVTGISVTMIPRYDLGGDFHCVNPLVTQLLPRLAARDVISPCTYGTGKHCHYHEIFRYHSRLSGHKPAEDTAGPQSVASTSSLDIEDLGLGLSAEDRSVVEMGEGRMENSGLAGENMLP